MNVAYQDSILYNDCELIFEAADETGRRYIAVHTGDYETGCEYLIAPASPESLIAFKNGKNRPAPPPVGLPDPRVVHSGIRRE